MVPIVLEKARKQCFVTKELVLRGQNGVRGVHVIEIVVAVFNFVVGNVKFQEEHPSMTTLNALVQNVDTTV